MYRKKIIGVVIPSYRVKDHIAEVVKSIPRFVDHIFVIDDACPEHSGRDSFLAKNKKVQVIFHNENTGVGGAVQSGYRAALESGCDIIVKVDGDGQMDTSFMESLITPIVKDRADYTKGNRFYDFKALSRMPFIRLFGNSALSFLVKLSSGYWNIFDPTNGYTAIHKSALALILNEKIASRYFFESDMLIHLGIKNLVVEDVPIPALYGEEKSSLSITRVILEFPLQLHWGFIKRIFFRYFVYDFNMGSVYLILGYPLFTFGVIFGIYQWTLSSINGLETPTGTIMLAALPVILGTQLLLQAIQIDMSNIPQKKRF